MHLLGACTHILDRVDKQIVRGIIKRLESLGRIDFNDRTLQTLGRLSAHLGRDDTRLIAETVFPNAESPAHVMLMDLLDVSVLEEKEFHFLQGILEARRAHGREVAYMKLKAAYERGLLKRW
jgi:hypothetical protein